MPGTDRHGAGQRPGETLLTATAYGRTVGLRVPDADLEAVFPRLPHWWDETAPAVAAPEQTWSLQPGLAPEAVIGELELWVAEHADGLVFVHAGVVAVDGRALLLPGRSFTGKSTLTRELLRCGADYGSDEYAVLSPDGTVQAYPRPLALRGETQRRVAATDLGAATFTGALPVAAVAALRYVPGGPLDIAPMTPATAVLRLFDNTVCASSRPELSFETLVALGRGIVAVEGVRDEAADVVPALMTLLRARHHSM
ncbi:MAG: hypothetical protein QOG80_1622 [Pseudonocardiales bacterium]|jgi:hypothetical protein|nr:hypothetical protein [Pseudonocardiales bacterium]